MISESSEQCRAAVGTCDLSDRETTQVGIDGDGDGDLGGNGDGDGNEDRDGIPKYLERFQRLSDTVDCSWQIEKLKS